MEQARLAAFFNATAPVAVYLRADSQYEPQARAGFRKLAGFASQEAVTAVVEAGRSAGWSAADWYLDPEGRESMAELFASESPDEVDTGVAVDLYNGLLELLVLEWYPGATMHQRDAYGGLYATLGGIEALQSDDSDAYGWFLDSKALREYLGGRWG